MPWQGIILGGTCRFPPSESQCVRQKTEDRRLHTYIVGQPEEGKNILLKNMAAQDIKDGNGVCFVDPQGDMASELLDFIPQERIKDVVYFNPGDPEYTLSFNILESSQNKQIDDMFAFDLFESMDKLYDLKSAGPMAEQYIINSLLLLASDPEEQFTLVDVSAVLTNEEFRKKLLLRATNDLVKNFWEKEVEKNGEAVSLNIIGQHINSRLAPFLGSNIMRLIIGQKKSSISFEDILNSKKIFIVNLSPNVLGEINSRLLGTIIVSKIISTMLGQRNISENQKDDFYLYLDEFQKITTQSFPHSLGLLKKYQVPLIIAHKSIAQLEEEIRNVVLGNVGTIVTFKVELPDCEVLDKYFDLESCDPFWRILSDHRGYMKLMIDGLPSKLFKMYVDAPRATNISYRNEVIENTNKTYGRLKKEVEKEIV